VLFLALISFLGARSTAQAVTIEGVEFTDFVTFSLPASGDLSISTSQDAYVFAPDPIFADVFDITADVEIIMLQVLTADVASFCAQLPACDTGPFTFDRDLLVMVLEPIGELSIRAGGSVVVAPQAIPEPDTSLLVGMGLGALVVARRWRRAAQQGLAAAESPSVESDCTAPGGCPLARMDKRGGRLQLSVQPAKQRAWKSD
jgi:hypothetical protein